MDCRVQCRQPVKPPPNPIYGRIVVACNARNLRQTTGGIAIYSPAVINIVLETESNVIDEARIKCVIPIIRTTIVRL